MWLSGRGTSLSIIAQFAETTSWTCASNARQTKGHTPVKSALSLGVFAIMRSTFIAYLAG